MNIIDIIILCCFAPAIIHGISKGFINQAFSLVALVLGVWLSFKFSASVGDWLATFSEIPGSVLHIIAFCLVLVVVIVVVKLFGKAMESLFKFVMLGWLNKLLGIVFALVKALLIIGLVVLLFDAVNSHIPLVPAKTLDESILYHPVKAIADVIFPFLKELIFNK